MTLNGIIDDVISMFTYANGTGQHITMTTFWVYYKCAHVWYSMEAPRRLAAKSHTEYLLLLNTLGKVPGSVVESIGVWPPQPWPSTLSQCWDAPGWSRRVGQVFVEAQWCKWCTMYGIRTGLTHRVLPFFTFIVTRPVYIIREIKPKIEVNSIRGMGDSN